MVKPVTYRILHLGLGAFHRAHQAWYINRLIEGGNDGWQQAGLPLAKGR